MVVIEDGYIRKSATAPTNTDSNGNTSLGELALNAFIGAGGDNTAIGFKSLTVNSSGEYNTAVGYNSLLANTNANFNSAFGMDSLRSNLTGLSNSALGISSLFSNLAGSENVAVGAQSLLNSLGDYNTALGSNSGSRIETGTGNVFIGRRAGWNGLQKVDVINSIAIGNGAYTTADGQINIGGVDITALSGGPFLPLGGGAMTGAITTNSTFDGVDVSAIPTTYLPLGGGAMTGAITTNSTFDGVDVSVLNTAEAALATQTRYAVALTPGATISLDPTLGSVFTLTPDQNCTINTASRIAGQVLTVIITATATSRVVTYGTGFLGVPATTTGTTAGKKFSELSVSDGASYINISGKGPL